MSKKKPIVGHTPHYKKGIGQRYLEHQTEDGRWAMVIATGVLDKDGTFYEWPDKPMNECFHAKVEIDGNIGYVPVAFLKDWPCLMVEWR